MRWRLGGPSGRANIDEAVTSVEVVTSWSQSPTVTIGLRDPGRELVNHRMLDDPATWVDVDDVRHRLVKVNKAGSALTLTFEDDAVVRLRNREGELAVSAGTVTRTGFIRRLASDAGVRMAVAEQTGASSDEQFDRRDDETSWAALRRHAEEINWHGYVVGGRVVWAPPRYLASAKTPVRLREFDGGVDVIDFDRDVGKKVDTATVKVHTDGRWEPGDPVEIVGLRPMVGRWLVTGTTRSPFTTSTTVNLERHER